MNIATRARPTTHLLHLLSEVCMRLQMVDLATETDCEIRIRQEDLADAVGVGRTLANIALLQLKTEGIIDYGRSTIRILDMKRLNRAGEFNRQYLHIARAG